MLSKQQIDVRYTAHSSTTDSQPISQFYIDVPGKRRTGQRMTGESPTPIHSSSLSLARRSVNDNLLITVYKRLNMKVAKTEI